jgi:Putative phage tail protein
VSSSFFPLPYLPGSIAPGLEQMYSWCRANGISAALCLDAQRSAKDLLDELFTIGNCAPVYSGNILKVIPYDEVSNAGYGSIFIAPTASGPIASLGDQDFVTDGKTPPVQFVRKRRTGCDNVCSIEYIDRTLDYAHNVISFLSQKDVALYGPRKGGTLDATDLGMNIPSGSKQFLSLTNAAAAQAIASILAKRAAAGANEYQFELKQEWLGLEAMDLVSITDTRAGIINQAVRLTEVQETAKRTLKCTADAFIYGLNHPSTRGTTVATGTSTKSNVDPGLVNAPIIFQPTAEMLPPGTPPQVWILVSGADPNFGGSIGYLSTDGGATYPNVLGNLPAATTGVLTADYPNHADPDTVDTLAVNLTESLGELTSQPMSIADGFADPCYVAGASAPAYEIVCPTTATLTSPNNYSLTTYIRRGVQGTSPMDHPIGSRFGVLGGAVLKVTLPPQWIGKTLYLKFAAYNGQGGQGNDLADCVAYTFTPVLVALPGQFYIN